MAQLPTISVSDVVVSEGQGYAEFVVSLSAPSALAVSLSYLTVPASALADGYPYTPDFALTGLQTLSFAPGETLKTVRVALVDDALRENTESFYLNLSSPNNGLIGKSQGTATIIDNDGVTGTPVITISDVLVDEMAGRAVFTLTLDRPSATTVGVNVATLDGTALANTDYQALTVQRVAFAPGEVVKTVVVNLIDDATTEPGEYFSLVLSSPVGATLPDTQAKATIAASDAANVAMPTISVSDVVVSEGQGYAEFVVSLSAPSALAVSLSYLTVPASALADGYPYTPDFALTGLQTLSFAPGETLKTVRVALVDDALRENTESFYLNLSSPNNGLIGKSQGTATIVDDDGLPTLSIGSVSVSEKDAVANFVVTLDKASTTSVSVTLVTVPRSATISMACSASSK